MSVGVNVGRGVTLGAVVADGNGGKVAVAAGAPKSDSEQPTSARQAQAANMAPDHLPTFGSQQFLNIG